MRTILFISFLLLLWCGFSSFESTSVRPNGWYYVIDMEHDSLSADPIVTVKDFARIKLDSVSDSNEDNMAYRILGVLDDSHKTTWAEATEKSIGKHIGFTRMGKPSNAAGIKTHALLKCVFQLTWNNGKRLHIT